MHYHSGRGHIDRTRTTFAIRFLVCTHDHPASMDVEALLEAPLKQGEQFLDNLNLEKEVNGEAHQNFTFSHFCSRTARGASRSTHDVISRTREAARRAGIGRRGRSAAAASARRRAVTVSAAGPARPTETDAGNGAAVGPGPRTTGAGMTVATRPGGIPAGATTNRADLAADRRPPSATAPALPTTRNRVKCAQSPPSTLEYPVSRSRVKLRAG
jgi:hypothetical protein